MKTGFLFRASFCVALLAWMLLLADYADARGRGRVGGGGRGAAAGAGVGAGRAGATAPGSAGGFSRSGPASSGSFASSGGSRLINTNVVNANIANTNVADTTILRGGGDPVAAVPGTVATAGAVAAGTAAVARARTTAVAALPCSADPVLVNGITYYKCDWTWFTRSYIDGDVAYVVTNPPG
ncbi:MAG TPA: hypothetical protein VHT21_19230 [Stellaceae bacterium]|jgi:hypothetical protein|nr:hypothetical protein [Stellaceae bacterium]